MGIVTTYLTGKIQSFVTRPTIGTRRLYAKNDGWYDQDSSGVETQLGGGSADIASGTYTPTQSANSNLDSAPSPSVAQYLRVGNVVTVSGNVLVAANGNPALTASFQLSLPIASDFSGTFQLGGSAGGGDSITLNGVTIASNVANNTAQFSWVTDSGATSTMSYSYTYLII